jgi:hypothetical protein
MENNNKRKRPSQGLIDMMNGGWEKLEEERNRSFSYEPIYNKSDEKLHISDVSDSSSTEMWKDIKKWIIIIFSWIIVLIFSLILLDNKTMMLSGWLLITGLVMWLKGKDYEKWYWKNYDNIRKVEHDVYSK